MHRYRSHTCAALRKSDVDSSVRLSGWVNRVRDHGGLLFIDTPFGPLELSLGVPVIDKSYDESELFRLSIGTRF